MDIFHIKINKGATSKGNTLKLINTETYLVISDDYYHFSSSAGLLVTGESPGLDAVLVFPPPVERV